MSAIARCVVRKVRRPLLIAGMLCLLAACGHAPPVPETQYHQLPPRMRVTGTADPVLAGAVVIRPFMADDLRQDRALVYSPAPPHLTLQQSHYHYWVDVPTRLLQLDLADYWTAQQLATTVLVHEEQGAAHWVQGRIERLDREIDGKSEQVHVELTLELGRNGQDMPEFMKVYSVVEPVPVAGTGAPAADQVILAFSTAITRLWAEFSADLHQRIPQGQTP